MICYISTHSLNCYFLYVIMDCVYTLIMAHTFHLIILCGQILCIMLIILSIILFINFIPLPTPPSLPPPFIQMYYYCWKLQMNQISNISNREQEGATASKAPCLLSELMVLLTLILPSFMCLGWREDTYRSGVLA